jgi:hypothetical protein
VQRTRLNAVAALEEYEKQPSQDPKRLKQLLKEVIIILFHSVQPPDRVGVIRRLRLQATLIEDGEGYNIDLTRFKHKTSKFYGPCITSVSPMIVPVLKKYIEAVQWDLMGGGGGSRAGAGGGGEDAEGGGGGGGADNGRDDDQGCQWYLFHHHNDPLRPHETSAWSKVSPCN